MTYSPLRTINPSAADVTVNSSLWLASRLMPGKGNALCSFPHYRNIGNAGMRTCANNDLTTAALLGMSDSQTIVNLENSAGSLAWRGLWTISSQTVIGRGHAAGLVCPLNSYNVGYRYKRGWRPAKAM